MQNPIRPVKNFVVRNRGKIAIVTTATTIAAVSLVIRNSRVTNDFLRDHGLFEEFYAETSIEA